MSSFLDLTERRCEPEIMDDPALDAASHLQALDGLARLNWFSGSARLVWQPLVDFARRQGCRQLRVLDVATGAGDLPIALWRRARRSGLELELCGIDVSERALDAARQRAAASGAPIEFRQLDVLNEGIPTGFDVVFSSLFLHHLNDAQAFSLLAAMRDATGQLMVVSDLERSRRGLLLVEASVRLLTRSPVVRVDGPLSIRAAFSRDEIRHMAERLELHGSRIQRRWPSRFVLTWQRGRTP